MTLAAVCCTGADSLALLDVETGTLRGTIDVGPDPAHLFLHGDDVWVATMGDRAVSVVSNGAVRRVETGVLGPSHFARAAGALFVPCTGGDATAVIDPGTHELLGRVHTGTEPHEVAVHDGYAYVGSRGDGTVTVVDAKSAAAGRPNPVEETIALPSSAAGSARVQGVESGPDGVFAIDQRGARVYKVVRREGVVADADVGTDPYEVTVTADRVFVPGRGDDTVHEFDHDLSRIGRHEVGDRPWDVVVLDRAWVVHRGESRLRTLDGGRTVDLPYPAIGAVPVGGDLLASHYDDAAVSRVDVATGRIRWTAEVGENPFGAAVI